VGSGFEPQAPHSLNWSDSPGVDGAYRRNGEDQAVPEGAAGMCRNRYLHTVDGRDAEITSALSDLAAHRDAARLPKSIVSRH
jgi:hypothetical protein